MIDKGDDCHLYQSKTITFVYYSDYLINAWITIEKNGERLNKKDVNYNEMESAIGRIQLLGTKTQVGKAYEFASNIAKTGNADASELLEVLRSELRKELKLKHIEKNLAFLRFKK